MEDLAQVLETRQKKTGETESCQTHGKMVNMLIVAPDWLAEIPSFEYRSLSPSTRSAIDLGRW